MAENQDQGISQPDELSQEDILLQGSYVLVHLKNQLREVKNKRPIKGFTLETAAQIFNLSFQETNLHAGFSIGNASYIAEKREFHDYLEIGFTKFPDENNSNIASEGFRIRVRRGNLPSVNFIEYHKKSLNDSHSEKVTNMKTSVSKAMEFISSIS